MHPYGKEDQQPSRLHSAEYLQQVEGGDPPHLLSPSEMHPGVLGPVLAPQYERGIETLEQVQ